MTIRGTISFHGSPRSDEHLFKTIRAHLAAKLPPALANFLGDRRFLDLVGIMLL